MLNLKYRPKKDKLNIKDYDKEELKIKIQQALNEKYE